MKTYTMRSFLKIALMALTIVITMGCADRNNGKGRGGGEQATDNGQWKNSGATALTLKYTNLTLDIGQRAYLNATPAGPQLKNYYVGFSSTNPEVAKVDANGCITAMGEGSATITAYSGTAEAECKVEVSGKKVNLEAIRVKQSGDIDPDKFNPNQKISELTFNRFPLTEEEFLKVREEIGATPQGGALLLLMAMELYHHDREVGQRCVERCCVKSICTETMAKLRDLYGGDQFYSRPYQVAGLLKGTSPEKGYNLKAPYKFGVQTLSSSDYHPTTAFGVPATAIQMAIVEPSGRKASIHAQVSFVKAPQPPSQNKYYVCNTTGGFLHNVEDINMNAQYEGLQ